MFLWRQAKQGEKMKFKTLKYELKAGLPIAVSGEEAEASFLEITSPTNEVSTHVSTLDSQFNKALIKMSELGEGKEQEKPEEDFELSGKEVSMMLASGGANLELCFKSLSKILQKTCKIDGEKSFTEVHFRRMDYNDTKMLLGEYIGFFLSSSLTT